MFQVRAGPDPATVDCDLRWDEPESVRAALKFEVRVKSIRATRMPRLKVRLGNRQITSQKPS